MKRDEAYMVKSSTQPEETAVMIDVEERKDPIKSCNGLSSHTPPPAYTALWEPTKSWYKRENRVSPMPTVKDVDDWIARALESLDKISQRIDRY